MLPAVAVLRSQMATPELSPKRRLSTITKKDAKGKEVPKDVVRRMEAEAEDPNNGVDRPLQLACIAAIVVPLAWAGATQEAPTAGEQLSGWASDSWTQLTDGKLTASFQLAAALLFIERLCYTWVHTFSASFSRFCKSAVGQAMGGEKPLDVVLKLFWANKVIQLGTFTVWYFYVIDFASPFDSGFSWAGVTRLQWVLLAQGLIAGQVRGAAAAAASAATTCLATTTSPLTSVATLLHRQGLNAAIYRAIGKKGVYYGHRLGLPADWYVGFPFTVAPHPQYMGVCMSVIGVNAFAATDRHVKAGWFNLTTIQVLYYVYMGLVEDYL